MKPSVDVGSSAMQLRRLAESCLLLADRWDSHEAAEYLRSEASLLNKVAGLIAARDVAKLDVPIPGTVGHISIDPGASYREGGLPRFRLPFIASKID